MDACGPGRQASPPRRPASGPGASTPGNGEGAHEVTARDHPAPGPACLPLRQGRAARQPPPRRAARPRGLSLFSPSPGPAVPGGRLPSPAGRGPDLTRRAERSVRRRGPTDGPPPGTPTAPGRPAATPDGEPGTPGDPLLTIEEVIAELRVSRAAFYRWRRQGAGPAVVRLPGGGVRVRRSALSQWLRRLEGDTPDDRSKEQMDSYDVRFWDIKRLGSGTGARFRVRWAVDGREHCKSFKARPLADGFLDGLKDAVRDRRPFSPRTGLPEAETTEGEMITWYEHARAYTEAKWGNLAPVSRRSVAEALVTVTIALTAKEPGAPEPQGAAAGAVRLGVQPRHPRHRPAARRSPPPSTGPNAPRCRSPSWKTPRRCGSRLPPAPGP